MRRIVTIALVLASLAFAFPAWAQAGLFVLSGENSEGEKVELALTEQIAKQIGVSEIKTKVVSRGEEIRSVKGILISTLLKYYDLAGNNLGVTALDGYAIDVPREDLELYPVLIALEIDGKALSVRDQGPAWIIYPSSDFKKFDDPVFDARSVWQLKTVNVNSK